MLMKKMTSVKVQSSENIQALVTVYRHLYLTTMHDIHTFSHFLCCYCRVYLPPICRIHEEQYQNWVINHFKSFFKYDKFCKHRVLTYFVDNFCCDPKFKCTWNTYWWDIREVIFDYFHVVKKKWKHRTNFPQKKNECWRTYWWDSWRRCSYNNDNNRCLFSYKVRV